MNHRQNIHRTEHQTNNNQHHDPEHTGKTADQDEEFTNEVANTQQTQRGGDEEQTNDQQPKHAPPNTTHLTQITNVQALVELATENEQRNSEQTVGDHLYHRTLQDDLTAQINNNQHETHVRQLVS